MKSFDLIRPNRIKVMHLANSEHTDGRFFSFEI